MTKTAMLFVGLPCVGKSSYIKSYLDHAEDADNFEVISTDKYIEYEAELRGQSYQDLWSDLIGDATKCMWAEAKWAAKHNKNILWDQTNLTKKKRAKVIKFLRDNGYEQVYCFNVSVADEEYSKFVMSRKNKFISMDIVEQMRKTFEYPTIDEGFDKVFDVLNTFKEQNNE